MEDVWHIIIGQQFFPLMGKGFYDSSRPRPSKGNIPMPPWMLSQTHSTTPVVTKYEWRTFQTHYLGLRNIRLVSPCFNDILRRIQCFSLWFNSPSQVVQFLAVWGHDSAVLSEVRFLRIDWAIPGRFLPLAQVQDFYDPQHPSIFQWPIRENARITLPVIPRDIHDETREGFEVKRRFFTALLDYFPNLLGIDTGFSGHGNCLNTLPLPPFWARLINTRRPEFSLQILRLITVPGDIHFVAVCPHLSSLTELAIDLVQGSSGYPTQFTSITFPNLKFLTLAGSDTAPPLAWVGEWTLPSLEYLAVRSQSGVEDRLADSLDNIGQNLTHLFLRGPFMANTLQGIGAQSRNLSYLEMDWSHSFPSIPPHPRLQKIHLYARDPNSGPRRAFHSQLRAFSNFSVNWPSLRCIQDSSICWIDASSDIKWWREAEIISLGTVDIACIDIQGLSLQHFLEPPPDFDEDQFDYTSSDEASENTSLPDHSGRET